MSYKENIFLKVSSTVILTPHLEEIIVTLEPYFAKKNLHATVTSGVREPEDQLRIIRQYLVQKGLDKKYPDAMVCKVTDTTTINYEGKPLIVYVWQMAWSNLLNVGIIINPPAQAKLLMDYINAAGKNRKGDIFEPSIHFKKKAIDIGGGGNGVNDEAAVVQEAINNKAPGIVSVVIEHNNNCVHINCT